MRMLVALLLLAGTILNSIDSNDLMKYKSLYVVLLLASVLGNDPSYGQNTLSPILKRARTAADYQPRTLQEITAVESVALGRQSECSFTLNGDLLPSRVRATYLGLLKPMPEDRKRVLQAWAQQFAGAPETYTKPYQTEMLFREDKTEHWLAIKTRDIPRVGQELQEGDVVELNVIRVGGVSGNGKGEWLLLVEDFQKR